MPDRPQPANRGAPPLGDGDLDELAHSLWGVEEILTALRASPGHGELTGEARALAEFRRVHPRPRHRRRRHTVPAMRLVAAAALIVVAVCGAAAETGRLPSPIQNLAHAVFAAPPTPVHTGSAHMPKHRNADTRASWLRACRDYLTESAAEGKPSREPGYGALVGEAGGSGRVANYCADRDFPRGAYPASLPETGADPRTGYSGPRTGDPSSGQASSSDGTAGSGRGHAAGTGPGAEPSPGAGPSPGAPTAGPGDASSGSGASSGGTTGSGSDPAPGPGHHYPGGGG